MEVELRRLLELEEHPLDLSYMDLDVLPKIPSDVKVLQCSGNNLTQLPELPRGLTHLYCSHNQLTSLPDPLPEGLLALYCCGNQLTYLPDKLPPNLLIFICENNHFPEREYGEPIHEYVTRINQIASQIRTVDRTLVFKEELMMRAWHPSRVDKWVEAGIDF